MIKLFLIAPLACIGALIAADWLTTNQIFNCQQSLLTLDNGMHITWKAIGMGAVVLLSLRSSK
jgi:hypothetical protein